MNRYCRYSDRNCAHCGGEYGDRSGTARLPRLGNSSHRAPWCWGRHCCDPSIRLARSRTRVSPISGTAVLEYGATEILPPVGAIAKHPARLCRPRRQADRPQPRGKPGFSTLESGCGRETDCLLEGDGFEPSVPRQRSNALRDCTVRAMTDNPACRRASRRKIGADRVVPVDRGGAADHEVMHCHLLCCLGNGLSTAGTCAVGYCLP
jgi:hypothetical protein